MTFAFRDEGVFPYYCTFHPGMSGAIVVGDASGPGATSEGGAFGPVDNPEPPPSEPASATSEPAGGTITVPIALGMAVLIGAAGFGLGMAGSARLRRSSALQPAAARQQA